MSTSVSELRSNAKLPAIQAGASTVAQFFKMKRSALAAVLPKHVSPDRMLRVALGALRTTPKLMNATTESLFGAVVQLAQLGLEPNTPMGHAYLIPFDNRKARRTDVQVIIGYRGLIDLARRSGQIVSLGAHAVREGDDFEFEFGLDEKLRHVPARGNQGEIIAVYGVAKLKDGGHQFEVMWREDVDAVMRATQSRGAYGPWSDHFEEMARKTAIRRLFKYLPVSIELATAVALDARGEAGEAQGLDGVLAGDFAVVDEDAPEQTPDSPPQEDAAADLLLAISEAGTLHELDELADSSPYRKGDAHYSRVMDALAGRRLALEGGA